MKPVNDCEVPSIALLKSAASEAIARQHGVDKKNVGADLQHPILKGIDHYYQTMIENNSLEAPGGGDTQLSNDDPEINAYLAMIHHQLVHARIASNKDLEHQLEIQRNKFKYGNPLWQQMMHQYFWYYWQFPLHEGQQPKYRSWKDEKWGNGNINYSVIEWKLPADATICVIGDIGTGTDVAATTLIAALSFKPDVIIHLGDVYYSGTPFEFAHRYIGLIKDVFKEMAINIPVFGIPGNHEYFTGGISYYNCLDSLQLVSDPKQRQWGSYFCLRTQDDGWQCLGMDTGYYGHQLNVPPQAQEAALRLLNLPNVKKNELRNTDSSPDMTSIRNDEEEWHRHKLQEFSGRTMLFSHHQLYSLNQTCGVAQKYIKNSKNKMVLDSNDTNRRWVNTKLWQQFGAYFSENIAAWFWGHEHSLGIFENGYIPAEWQKIPNVDSHFKPLHKGRCVGHAAIPVQEKEAPYEKKFPVSLVQSDPKLGLHEGWYNRGFQILKLEGKGKPGQARYYQVVEDDPKPLLVYEEKIV